MATNNELAAGVALAAVLWMVDSTDAAGRTIQLELRYSGSTVTRQDSNGDGIRSALGILTCTSNLGRCTAQGVGEASSAGPGTCPNGHPGLRYTVLPGTGHGFTHFERTGDMLFTKVVSETACYDTTTGVLYKSGTDEITGGTGRFAGATGESRFEGTQWLLYIDAGGNAFAAQAGTASGTIVIPDRPASR
jgi:hypothetical protein